MHHRLTALIILLLLTMASFVAYVHLILRCIFHPDDRAREILIGLDFFVNAGAFGGSRWETVSSHTGREVKKETGWALLLSWLLNQIEPGHCTKANDVEQPVMDLLQKHGYK